MTNFDFLPLKSINDIGNGYYKRRVGTVISLLNSYKNGTVLYESDHSDFQYVYREGPLQAHTTIDPITLAPNITLFMACSERIMRACKV